MDGEPLPQTRLLKFKPGDQLLLCTDVLAGMLSDQQIQSILNEFTPLGSRCQRLVDAANQAGARTILLFCCFRSAVEKKIHIQKLKMQNCVRNG